MSKFYHIVQVHPIENGKINLYKVHAEWEFNTKEEADECINIYNKGALLHQAVYVGMVNDKTGELV